MTVVRMTYPKLFAKMSGHFLIQELPDNWDDTLTGMMMLKNGLLKMLGHLLSGTSGMIAYTIWSRD